MLRQEFASILRKSGFPKYCRYEGKSDFLPLESFTMFQPKNTEWTKDESLEDYIDYEVDDLDSIESENNETVEEGKTAKLSRALSAVADIAAKVFIRPRPIRYIDSNDQNQFVSKEDSEYRLLLIYIGWTLIVSLTTTALMITCPFYCINQDIVVLNPEPKTDAKFLRVPHVLVIYQNGSMLDFSTNEKLSPSKNVSTQLACHSKTDQTHCSVSAYAYHRKIYIFYGNTKRDITEIDIDTFTHRIIHNTKVKHEHENGFGIHIGNRFLILGGFFAPAHEFNCDSYFFVTCDMGDKRQGFVSRSNNEMKVFDTIKVTKNLEVFW